MPWWRRFEGTETQGNAIPKAVGACGDGAEGQVLWCVAGLPDEKSSVENKS